MKAYPRYKDSGIEWLGEVPEHWEIKCLRYVSQCFDGRRIPLNSLERSEMEGQYPYWGANGIVDYIDSYLFDEELVLLGEDGAPFFEEYKTVAFIVNGKIWVNNHIHVLKAYNINAKYFSHCLNNADYAYYISGSTRDKLTQSDMSTIPIPIPNECEQQTIVAFLDHETARIDALIQKKERMIELLKEKRIALITQAVTKGLDPKTKMKDSGIEWLGEVPEHWEILRIKNLLLTKKGAIKTGPFGSQLLSSEMEENDIKVYNQKSVISKEFDSGDEYISSDKFEELRDFQAFPGDFLITTRGTIGRCMILPQNAENGILHPCLMRIQTNKNIVYDRYLELLIENSLVVIEQLKHKSNGTTIEVIYQDSLKNVKVAIPPLKEQISIASTIDENLNSMDSIIAQINSSISLLHEYRASLIHHAVSGKIDLRGYHAETH